MALPVTISASSLPDQNYYVGPFKSSGGNFYLFTRGGNNIKAMKATDPTSSFSEQNAAGAPLQGGFTPPSIWCHQVGDTIHIASMVVDRSGMTPSATLYYHAFTMSSDTWTTADQSVHSGFNPDGTSATPTACSIAVRSDGDRIIFYQGPSASVMGASYSRLVYARWEGSSWTTNISIDNGGESNWTNPVVVPGSSDRMHLFFAGEGGNNAYQRTLRSDNTLQTFPSAYQSLSTSTILYPHTRGVTYNDGGTQRVRTLLRRAAGGELFAVSMDSGDSPTPTTADIKDTDNIALERNNSTVGCMTVDGTTLHAVWSHITSQDLMHDTNSGSGWGTDVNELAATIERLSAAVLDRSGAKIAYVYTDSTTVKYNEVTLAAGAQTITCSAIGSAEAFGTTVAAGPITASAIGSAETHGSHTLTPSNTLTASAIASAEAFGSASVNATLSPSGLASAEAFGTLAVHQNIVPTAVSPSEAFGTTSVSSNDQTITCSAIGSAEAHGTAQVHLTLTLAGVASAEAIGAAVLTVDITVPAIGSGEVVPSPRADLTLTASAAAPSEAFGTALVGTLQPSGVASGEAFGTATLSVDVAPAALASGEAFGAASVNPTLSASAIGTAEAFGTAQLDQTVSPAAVASAEAFGTLALGLFLAPSGVASGEATGALVAYIHAEPDADASIDSWTDQAGGTAGLFDTMNEEPPSDADYARSPLSAGTGDFLEVALRDVEDPQVSSNHLVRYRIAKSEAGGSQMNLTVQLRQGASTVIASWGHTNVGAGFATIEQTLSGAEADAITDYADLRLRFVPETV